MNRAAAKIFAKVLPIMHHYVCMDFGISKQPYESEPLLYKLGLSRKFPRTALYLRRSMLEVGLMLPSIIIAMLKLKQYIGNKWKRGNAAQSIVIQEEYQEIEAGRVIKLGEDPAKRYWTKVWIDEVNDELWKRNMTLISNKIIENIRTTNKTIMKYVVEYVEIEKRIQRYWGK